MLYAHVKTYVHATETTILGTVLTRVKVATEFPLSTWFQ